MSLQTPPSLDDLLRILDAATDKGGLHWTTTAEEGTFRAELGIGMVRLAKEGTGPRYKLTLLDSDGTLLEEYLPSGEGTLLATEALYKKARRKALKLDWKLKGLYDHLRALAGES